MSEQQNGPYRSRKLYVPGTLGEVDDLVGSMVLGAPRFTDKTGTFPDRNIDTRFHQLTEGLARVRAKLGDELYAKLIDLADRAKALFAADQEDANGKTDEGRALLFEMEELIDDVRRRRFEGGVPDYEGRVTGD